MASNGATFVNYEGNETQKQTNQKVQKMANTIHKFVSSPSL